MGLSALRGQHGARRHPTPALPIVRTLALLAAAFLATAASPGASEGVVRYSGEITEEKNRSLFASVADRPVHRLVITSGGGSVQAGVALGRWVFENGLDVEVADHCLSSCANYVFTAGHRKRIRPGAVVAWHGSYTHLDRTDAWPDDIAYRMRTYGEDADTARSNARRTVDRLVALERAFFREIGVDGFLCWVGKMPPHEAPDYYTLSVADMARFGVTGVVAPQPYPGPAARRTDVNLVHVELQDRR
jgi:hypothetical protein